MSGTEVKCRHCGGKFIAGFRCGESPTKQHVAISDGQHCVYCGQKFVSGFGCTNSPTKKHKLEE